jgi:glycerol 3-phosphatase-2
VTEPALARADGQPDLPRPSERPPSEVYDVALLDLDGVVYLSGAAVPGAPKALAEARHRGMRLAFVTNNASRSASAIAAQLTGLGVPATSAEVVTSAHAAAHLLADRLPAGAPVLVVGDIGLRIALRERGLRPVSTAAERPAAVVQGYGPDVGYPLLAEAGLAVRAGAWYVASNVDATLPTARGIQPGNGSLVQVIVTATGQKPVVAGKPEPPLYTEAVARAGARRPLVVGDRLDTDIEGAVRVGADSMLVLTGVTRPADAVLAPRHRRPTYLAHDLAGLLEPHPPVTGAGGSFRCGGWTARLAADADAPVGRPGPGGRFGADGRPGSSGRSRATDRPGSDGQHDRLEITGTGPPIDGLRALCAAAWSAGAVTADSARSAVACLHFPT